MNQLLDILSDVMLIATFQWRDKGRRGQWRDERPASSTSCAADRHPIRRFRP